MPIDSKNKKLSLISFYQPYNTPIPSPSEDTIITSGDKQHLIWGYSGITWGIEEIITLLAMEKAMFSRIFSRIFGRIN